MDGDGQRNLARAALSEADRAFGNHPGYRAAHAKGMLCAGRFVSSGNAAHLTRALHMQAGAVVDVTARFSNASNDPTRHDGVRDARGMAVKFNLPDGSQTDIVAVSLPRFFARTPEEFVKFNRALVRIRSGGQPLPLPWRLSPFLLARVIRMTLGFKRIPSYSRCRYNAIHAFRWIDDDDAPHHVRYSWAPEAGEAKLVLWLARWRDPDYLRQELAGRLDRGPVRFRLEVQLAEQGDPIGDPTALWPNGRRRVVAGVLELTEPATWSVDRAGPLVFDPTRVTDGIEVPPEDQVLGFRPLVYELSVSRRSGA